MKSLLLAVSLLAFAARPAHACDPTESPDCPDTVGDAMVRTGLAMMATVPVGGLITAIGGAARPRSKDWRRANYIFGTLSLIEAMAMGIAGAVYYYPGAPQFGGGLMGGAAGVLAVGATDIGLAVASAVKSSQPRTPRMMVVPLASRDLGGLALTGRF